MLGVTPDGKLLRPGPASVQMSPDDVRVLGFAAAAVAFIALQYMLFGKARPAIKKQVSFAPDTLLDPYEG